MIGVAAAFLVFLLPKSSAQLLTTDAKCLTGYDWTYNSINQSPCDVAAELAGVCVGGSFNLSPLPEGYVYLGPTQSTATDCRCSTVYYSMLSACAYCQGRNWLSWTGYNTNCTTVYVTVYNQQIPVGAKVPAYAYQNVVTSNTFNVTLAQSIKGTESTRPPAPSTSSTYAVSSSTTVSSPAVTSSTTSGSGSKTNVAAIVGGVVGGLVALGLIGALITFLVIRSQKKAKSQAYDGSFQQSPNMAYTPNTTASLIPHTTSPPPGSPGRLYDPNDPTTYPDLSTGHGSFNMYSSPSEPHRQLSPYNPTVTPNFTGASGQSHGHIPTLPVPQHTGPAHYTGAPEL